MANSKPTNKQQTRQVERDTTTKDSITSLKSLDDIYSKNRSSTKLHKSFDFSNIAIFGENKGFTNNPNDDANFRHFHQMRIYIQVPSVFKYGNYQSLKNCDTILLTSNLPESISYTLGSNWEAPLAGTFGNATNNLLMQMAGKALHLGPSGVPRAATMRIWSGSKPLSMDLKIPVIDDGETKSNTNLMEALEILGSLALPSTNSSSFYTPPPSPLNLNFRYRTDINDPSKVDSFNLNNGAVGRIIVQLGGMLLVDYCVIESFSVNYPSTKTMIMHDYSEDPTNGLNYGVTSQKFLHPLLAEVNIKISTVEAVTAGTYAKMLWGKPQTGQGKVVFDAATGVMGVLSAGLVGGARSVIDAASAAKNAIGL